MKRLLKIATVLSTIFCCVFLILLPLSYFSRLPEPAQNGGDSNGSIVIGDFHYAATGGFLWLFTGDFPYQGSIIGLADPSNETRIDWSWVSGRFGLLQESVFDSNKKFLRMSRYGDFPGVYYRHFEWVESDKPWTTLRMSLLYPIAFFAVLPFWWLVQKIRSKRHSLDAKPLDNNGVE